MERLGIILIITAVLIIGCDDEPEWPVVIGEPIESALEVRVLDMRIFADLMPIVPPDPINCRLTLSVENRSSKYSYTGLHVPAGAVFLAENGLYLGDFFFSSNWDGKLGRGEADTFRVLKMQSASQIFPPRCGDSLYIRFVLDGGIYGRIMKRTGNIGFQCFY